MPKKSYPVGTPVSEITRFDRSTKVAFHCKQHPAAVWVSKDPWVSTWFPGAANQPVGCACNLGTHVTTQPYEA